MCVLVCVTHVCICVCVSVSVIDKRRKFEIQHVARVLCISIMVANISFV